MVIWKFPLHITDRQAVTMPAGARILSLQMQQGAPTLWALCDPSAQKEVRRFVILGTGIFFGPEHDAGEFVGTVQSFQTVWHVFEART